MPLTRSPLRTAGALLIAAGVVVNPWLIGRLATQDGSIGEPDKWATVLFVDLVAILVGVQCFWPWVDRLSWSGRASAVARGGVTTLVAATAAVTLWGFTSYNQAHHHAEIVGPAHDHGVTPEQERWARDFHARSLAAARRNGWFDIDTALTKGFQKDRINRTHYPNLEYMFDDAILDPERPEWLIYDDSPDGKVLMGLMFFTKELLDVGPTPGGTLAQWHYHPYDSPRCAVKGIWTVGQTDEQGACAEGIPVTRTPEMFHVWFIDHPLGRFTEMKIVPEYWQEGETDLRRMHPVAVHFAVALCLVAILLDLAGLVTGRDFHRAAWINLVLALIGAIVAVGTGMTAEILLTPTHEAHQTLDLHRPFGYAALATVAILVAWRYALRGAFPRRGVVLYVLVSLAGAGAVGGAGYYGGEMVYTHGAAVRSLDRFAREQYWKQVRDVYRHPAETPDGPGLP